MLLYLSSNENIEIFDLLTNKHGIVIKKLSGTFNLKQFVTRDMRSLNHYAYFAIDAKALKDSIEETIEAIKAFNSMFSSRMIFYIEDIETNKDLTQKLIEEGIFNIISAPKYSFSHKPITIAVTGAAHKIFSFVQDNAKIEMQNKYKQVFFAEYSPELFGSEKNQDIWEKILENHIVKNGK